MQITSFFLSKQKNQRMRQINKMLESMNMLDLLNRSMAGFSGQEGVTICWFFSVQSF